METIARVMGFDGFSMQLGFGGITASLWSRGRSATLVHEVGVPGVNTQRIGALEELARTLPAGAAPRELAARLTAIESLLPRYTILQTAAAVGAACGAFALLNRGAAFEVAACAIGAGLGQALRSLLLRRRFNQYAVTLMSALIAVSVYGLASAVMTDLGLGTGRHRVGLISSVLFLVPGFPLVTALLDLLQQETAVAVSRLGYATTLLFTAAFGLFLVGSVAGLSGGAAPPGHAEPLMLAVRALASFVGACGFAILYNGSWRNVLQVGTIAIFGNLVRLALHEAGLALPSATFVGALTVGLLASAASRWLHEARVTLTVPGIIMMVPGVYAFEALAAFNQGAVGAGLEAAVLVSFVVGAIAMGLAVARLATQPQWLRD
jgi:uncharacterized membrane protein YjjB (DUF3815 family)